MAKTDPLDPNVPPDTEDINLGDDRMRAGKRAVAELLNVDHYMGTDGGAGTGYNEDAAGEHKKVKFNAPISTPTNAANKLFLYGKDVGGKIELHILDEDGNEIQLSSAGKVYAPNLLMPSGGVAQIETIRAVDATGILLQNDTPATVITIGDDGKATLADGSALATSAAPTTDPMLANKKYVNDQDAIADDDAFGTRTANDSDTNPLAATSIYKAGSDGFVTFNTVQGSSGQIVELKSDSSATPSTVIAHMHGDWGAAATFACVPIKKNDYWQITVAGGASVQNIKWLPIGSGTCVKQ